MGDVLLVWTAVSNMFGARMRTTLFLAACIHRYRVLFTYAACSKKLENEEETLVDVV